jgi:peptidoglycan glycosyltransferase/penicillin-binding protein 2
VIKGYSIAQQAVAMRSRQIELKEFSRGKILDRNLLPLTDTITSNAVYCFPQEIVNSENNNVNGNENSSTNHSFADIADFLSETLNNNQELEKTSTNRNVFAINGIDKNTFDNQSVEVDLNIKDKMQKEIFAKLNNADRLGSPFVRIASDLTDKGIQKINSADLPGLVIAPIIKRYRDDGFCAHLLGYVTGDSTNSEGKAGIEKAYNDLLKAGSSSQELISVLDARGAAIQGLMFKVRQEQDKQKGSVVLTIDKRIQEVVENGMSQKVKKGTAVVIDVRSKEILAMASRPTFNPYDIKGVLNSRESALTNRALNRYYPGSLFKILVTAAAIEEGLVDSNDRFNCTGKYQFNEEVSIPCWQEEGHGSLDFVQAFTLSCNPAFIEIGLNLGRQRLIEYAEKMHVTDERIIGFDQYSSGSYVKINPGAPAIGNACLGQQGIMVSPLQVASLIATIADNGNWAPPCLVRYTTDQAGKKEIPVKPEKKQVISQETAKKVQELMSLVVSQGTGKTAAASEVKVAGKTATSQTGNIKDDKEILNAWFGGFFPADNPKWAIVVLVEEGKTGAEDAAPVFKEIARDMLDYFSITE